MIILVSKIVFILSLLGILFIIIRKLPALSQLPEEPLAERPSPKAIFTWFRDITKRLILSNFFQNIILGNLEKSLRKFKILALKIDNLLDKFLRRVKRNSRE
jgi:hypothetical protein